MHFEQWAVIGHRNPVAFSRSSGCRRRRQSRRSVPPFRIPSLRKSQICVQASRLNHECERYASAWQFAGGAVKNSKQSTLMITRSTIIPSLANSTCTWRTHGMHIRTDRVYVSWVGVYPAKHQGQKYTRSYPILSAFNISYLSQEGTRTDGPRLCYLLSSEFSKSSSL